MAKYSATLPDLFRALADPTRLAVVQRLSAGPATVSELAQPFDMALPSFVQHLRVLEDSNLIRSKKVGRVRTCELRPESLATAEQWMAEQRDLLERHLDDLEHYLTNDQT